MQRNRMYIAGPMKGYPKFNFPAFDEAAGRARKWGWEVISPAEMDRAIGFDENRDGLEAFDMQAAQRRDIEAILSLKPETDVIALLPGWEKSIGAQAEKALGIWRGLKILDAEDFMPIPKKSNILDDAKKLVYGPRQESYGHPYADFSRTGKMWAAILGIPEVTPEQVALCMITLKISRLCQTPDHHDSQIDMAGYAGTYALVREKREFESKK
jgi:Domain of unknown function (DUF6378)/Domain of unknown function (DUF4406)